MDERENEIYYKPEFLSLPSYENEDVIREKFPSLSKFNLEHPLDHFHNSQFVVIRSKKSDDIHKAIKYGVWTSSDHNNKKIENLFQMAQERDEAIFFLFTYMNAPGFVGLAVLESINLNLEFPFWGEIGKWIGVMRLNWIYVRDVNFEEVKDLKETKFQGELKYMDELTDGSKISYFNALKIIEIMNKKKTMSSIFEKFVGHDFQEKKARPKLEEIIRTNMMDIYKQKALKKTEGTKVEAKVEEEPVLIVPKKKMTQGELKKLRKQNQNN